MGKPLAGTTLNPVTELPAWDKKPRGERVNCHTTAERMWFKPGHRGALAGSGICSAFLRLEFTREPHPVLSSSDVFPGSTYNLTPSYKVQKPHSHSKSAECSAEY